ncbi:hypothetical protein OS493_003350 [Desmophyllum pertusum]|uniref:Uncharacterized protein n=1 Tax=Desmophyllum pertusum TaxID=174260 RepID=A0A9X0A5E0_9CNID|nr:hypothetical protein OS493_003350 [Desmophyllum pertusum]
MFPDGDDVMAFRRGRLEQGVQRTPLDSSYPLSLVDIVEGLEDKSRGQEGGLDTTDSGYSQDTNKEKSPLTTENVNSDDEEATVLEDIFFLSGRV